VNHRHQQPLRPESGILRTMTLSATESHPKQHEFDIIILGGGIAGLWLLNRLRTAGYHAILLEKQALGAGQSIASQGMIHGGLKYALGGALTGASEAIADMPAHWKKCLDGTGDVDLRGTRILSEAYYMWPRNSLRSRFNAFFGSRAVRGKVTDVDEADWPAFFQGQIKGPLYRLHDLVLDVPSLLHTLRERALPWIYQLDPDTCEAGISASKGLEWLKLPDGTCLSARRFICTAGAGNEALLKLLPDNPVAMQRRPLQMMIVRHRLPHPVYVHCVSDQLSATPELTITTHPCADGRSAWYLGGELAEAGANRSAEAQLEATRNLLASLFPWCDFSTAEFSAFRIDRAEARQANGKRPDHDSVLSAGRLLYCWPTKLTLTPNMANRVLQLLAETGIVPQGLQGTPLSLPSPVVATPPWDLSGPN